MTKQEILANLEQCDLEKCGSFNAQIIDSIIKNLRNEIFVSNIPKHYRGNIQLFAEKYITFKNMDQNPKIFGMDDGRTCIFTNCFCVITKKDIDKKKVLNGFNTTLIPAREQPVNINQFVIKDLLTYGNSDYEKINVEPLEEIYLKIRKVSGHKKHHNLAYCIKGTDYVLEQEPIVCNARYFFDILTAMDVTHIYRHKFNNRKPIVFTQNFSLIDEIDFAVLMPMNPFSSIEHAMNEVYDYSNLF